MRRYTLITTLMLVAALLGAIPAAGATAEEGLHWEPCFEFVAPVYECAVARVPLDHDKPNGQTIPIAMVRIPASNQAGKIGSIFFNPGGPGGSGVDFVLGAGPFIYTNSLRARFDFVGFDPRGIGRSAALQCFNGVREIGTVFPPFPFPIGAEEEAIQEASGIALNELCQQRARSIIDHMSTADVARDMDLMRQMVGDDRLNYAGYSYGSFLGTTYVNLFPDTVRAVVVDAVLDPIAWTTGEPGEEHLPFSVRLRSAEGVVDTLSEFFRLCDEAGPAGCAFAGDSAARLDAIMAHLAEAPVEFFDPTTGQPALITQALANALLAGAMYDSSIWVLVAEFMAALEAVIAGAGAADVDLGPQVAELQALVPLDPVERQPYPGPEGSIGVACSDSDNPDEFSAWSEAAAAHEAEFPYGGAYWTWASAPCAAWEASAEDRYTGPFTAETSNTVLIVGNLYDPATPYHGAVKVRDLLPNSSLLTLDGWGHASLFLSRCIDRAVSQYFLSGRAPADGTVCAQDFTPFAAAPASADDLARQEARNRVLGEVALVPGS